MVVALPELGGHALELRDQVREFMRVRFFPEEHRFYEAVRSDRWVRPSVIEEWKAAARQQGLWNLFLPDPDLGAGLTHLEYAHIAEEMGRSVIASEIFNCSAPDTGNMEVLWRYGSPDQRDRYLTPLLNGEIRSGFAMTEPEVASSDATNMRARLTPVEGGYRLNAHKWWTTGALDPNCAVFIVMARSNDERARHQQHSMVLVPRDAPGVEIVRPLHVFGYDDAPYGHAEMLFNDVFVPEHDLILGEGRGFEIAQGRLGPGRIHHCMRLIGLAERALESMCDRAESRVAFGKTLAEQGVIREQIARSRVEINQARLLTHHAAALIDAHGNKAARAEVAMIKVAAPQMAQQIIDRAIQIHGGAGLSDDTFLAHAFAWARILRLADGPDEVHLASIAKRELRNRRQQLDHLSEIKG
jgi:acyl-CoA dehydrogenase